MNRIENKVYIIKLYLELKKNTLNVLAARK